MEKDPIGWFKVNGKFVSEVTDTLYNSVKEQAFSKCLDLIALQIRELIGCHQSAVSYIPGGVFAKGIHTTSLTEKYAKYRKYDVLPTGTGIWALLFEKKQTIRMNEKELYKHPRFKQFSDMKTSKGLKHPPLPGWLAVPIISTKGEAIGALQLSDKYEGEFSCEDQKVLENYAQMIASTFEIQFKEDKLSEHKHKISALDKLAHKDYLTQIPNRYSFDNYLHTKFPRESVDSLTIILVDLDSFKAINDTLGHFIGDEILKETAKRLKKAINNGDFVARLGGDEFAVISHAKLIPKTTIDLAEKIIKVLRKPFKVKGNEILCTVSIGIADTTCTNSSEKLLQNADMALYRVKQRGRNNYLYYEESLDNKQKRALAINASIQQAANNNEFSLVFQPIIDLKNNKVFSIEALIRWDHPTLGALYPDEFIIIAEQYNKIHIITEWVIDAVCQQIKHWRDEFLKLVPVSINISASDIMLKNFADVVSSITQKYNVPAKLLQFELTETSLFVSSSNAVENLEALNNKGYIIAIDDFGTGYSSLSKLDIFPINILKVDKSFIDNIERLQNIKIIESIIGIAKSYQYQTVIEGIETKDQYKFITKYGFDYAQGYYFAKPKSSSEIFKLLASRTPK